MHVGSTVLKQFWKYGTELSVWKLIWSFFLFKKKGEVHYIEATVVIYGSEVHTVLQKLIAHLQGKFKYI